MSSIETCTVVKTGKRKRQSSLVLHLSGGSTCDSDDDTVASEFSLVESPIASSSKAKPSTAPIIVNGKLVADGVKRYRCTFEGCTKSYKKPARLEEHERTHTGERPFICTICQKTYLRDTHLQAHVRSHLPDSSRPFACTHDGCEKKFWTAQHLRRHEELHSGEKPFKCPEPGCHESFAKHSQLRSHFALAHCPPGTKTFQCEHQGCTKSFATSQKLNAHAKTHEERRYTCSHPSCLQNQNQAQTQEFFPNWTALQAHTRTAHPPTCPYPSCNGKTFTQQKGLKAHLKIHEQREIEEAFILGVGNEGETGEADDGEDADADDEGDEFGRPDKKRRRGGEVGRDWVCSEEGCDKDFKSRNGLETHVRVSHLHRRDFVCPVVGCAASFGYKHLLQRHTARVHVTVSASGDTTAPAGDADAEPSAHKAPGGEDVPPDSASRNANTINILTGKAYSDRAKKKNVLRCPYPDLSCLLQQPLPNEALSTCPILAQSANSAVTEQSSNHTHTHTAAAASNATTAMSTRSCSFVFSRTYDLRRHLSAVHALEMDREEVEALVEAIRRRAY